MTPDAPEAAPPANPAATPLLNLTDDPEPATASPVGTARYDPSEDQEWIRGALAMGLLLLIAAIALALLAAALTRWLDTDALAKVGGILLTPILTLFGAVTGFYYGGKSGQR